MNANLEKLQAYPFERLADLLAGVRGNAEFPHIALSIGEPKHAPPEFVINLLSDPDRLRAGLGAYPATRGIPELREAISGWLARRYGVRLDPDNQVLPVAGTREALFSFGLAALSGKADARVLMPNPFYQIYEGAALLGNGVPHYVNCDRANDYQPDFAGVPDSVWSACEVVYLCSPGNPTGETIPEDTVLWLLEQADRHDFVVAADECYSEIYLDDSHPPAPVATTTPAALLSTAFPSVPACPGCVPDSSPATPQFSPATSNTARTKDARCPCTSSRPARPRGRTKLMWKPTAPSTDESSRRSAGCSTRIWTFARPPAASTTGCTSARTTRHSPVNFSSSAT